MAKQPVPANRGRAPRSPLAAIEHPCRQRIILELARGRELSPRDLARRLDEPLGNISYHVKMLAQDGVVVEARREPVRGAIKHYYAFGPGAATLADELRTLADLLAADRS